MSFDFLAHPHRYHYNCIADRPRLLSAPFERRKTTLKFRRLSAKLLKLPDKFQRDVAGHVFKISIRQFAISLQPFPEPCLVTLTLRGTDFVSKVKPGRVNYAFSVVSHQLIVINFG
jgi:hypothetical protein